MYNLAVTYSFDLDHHDRRSATERATAVVEFLRTLPGFIDANPQIADPTRLILVSSWSSQEAADSALNGERVNAELAVRAGAVVRRPDAISVSG